MIGRIQVNIDGDLDAREQAKASLLPLPGIEEVSFRDDTLHAAYELPQTSAAAIIEVIESSGLTLALSWHRRLRLWLLYYREAIFEENLKDEIGWDSCVREVYVSRYRHRRHGRRDDRPRHWRQYSTPPSDD